MTGRASRCVMVNHAAQLGGAELSLLDLASHRPGQDILVFEDGPLVDRLRAHGLNVSLVPGGSVLDIRRDASLITASTAVPALLLAVGRLAYRFRRYDVVYANSQKAFVLSALASAISRTKLVWHLHDMLTADHFGGGMRRLAVELSNRFTHRVIVNSQATADAYRSAGGRAPVVVIHNGIDPKPFEHVDRTGTRTALEREIGGSGPIIGLFGRLAPWKGHDTAIRALVDLPALRLVMVGGAFENDRHVEGELRDLVRRLGVEQRTHFLGFRADVAGLMSAVDIVAHCSTAAEPFGRVIVEGMMAGKPVVATAAGGALEIVQDGATGLLVPPGDVAALVSAVLRLSTDRELARRLAETGRRVAHERFSLAGSIDQLNRALIV